MFPKSLTLGGGGLLWRNWRCITRASPAPSNSCELASAMAVEKRALLAFLGLSLQMNSSCSISVCTVAITFPLRRPNLLCIVLEWVIPHGWTECITEESQHAFQRGMRSIFIPVAKTDSSLFTAVLYVSARRYSLISDNTTEAERYHKLMIQYLLTCLQRMKAIINKGSGPTDAAMALALCMATEAVSVVIAF